MILLDDENKLMGEEAQLDQLDQFGSLEDLWHNAFIEDEDDGDLLEQFSNINERSKGLEDRYEMIIIQSVLLV